MAGMPVRSLTVLLLAGAIAAEDAAVPADPQPVLVVTGKAEASDYVPAVSSTATRTESDPGRLPVSVGVVPAQVLADQDARTVYEGIRNVSGVVQNRGVAFNSASDGAIIRGFRNTSMYWNGFLVEAAGAFNPQTIERLEVLKGPASMLYGVVEPGGLVNVVSKQPTAEQSTTVEQSVGSFDRVVTNVDTSGAIGTDGSAYRLVAGGLSSESFRDYVEEKRYWAAPSVAFRLGERTAVTAEVLYSKQQKTLDEGVSFDRSGNPVAPISTFLGEPGLPGRTQTDLFASARIVHQLTETLKIRSGFLYHSWDVDLNAIRRSVNQATVAGNVNRLYDRSTFDDTSYQWTSDLLAKVQAGPTSHELMLGVDARWQKELIDLHRAAAAAVNITNPVYYQALPATPYQPANDTRRRWISGYLHDNAALLPDGSLRALAGVRYDRVISESIAQSNGAISGRDDNAWTSRVGAMWFPIVDVGVYANVAQSFVPTGAATQTFDGVLLDPEIGLQYEVGLKATALDRKLQGTLAVYRLTKDNVPVNDPYHSGFSVNGGKQRSEGIELDTTANLPLGLDLIGSLTLTRTEIVESTSLPEGEPLENVPDRCGSLWLMYTIPAGALRDLSFGAGVFAESSKLGYNALTDVPNAFKLPGYARFDASAAYRFKLAQGQLISTRISLLNAFDTTYYESSFASTRVFPGDPRTITLTVSATF